MIEYSVASIVGHVWSALRRSLDSEIDDLSAISLKIAHGEQVSAEELWIAQDFAARAWVRAGFSSMVLMAITVVPIAALPSRNVRDIALVMPAILLVMAVVALAEAGILRVRSLYTKSYMLTVDPDSAREQLPAHSLGAPSKLDFWVVLTISLALCSVMLYAGLH